MAGRDLDKLAELITRERAALLSNWREQVRLLPSARGLDTPTLNDHMPGLIDELAVALRAKSDQSIPEALLEQSPPAHGLQRLEEAFDIHEVVAEYNILRACIHDLADRNDLNLQGTPFHIVNRVLDHAIGLALQAYSTERALEVQRRREQYLAFVAHDLRTPLNAISLAGRVLELTVGKTDSNAETNRMLRALRRNVQHLETLVGKVLEENTSLQTEAGVKLERREFDLWPLVEALIHDLHPAAGTGSTRLVNHVPEDLVVYADAGLLKRAFQNLIANAIKHTSHGEVVIGGRERKEDGAVDCWVSDNGTGIPAELRRTLFDPDKAVTEAEDGGLGLGLAIVRTFVEAHGGEVWMDDDVTVGSTFRFTLPMRAAR